MYTHTYNIHRSYNLLAPKCLAAKRRRRPKTTIMTSKYLYLFVISHSTQSHKTAVFPLWLQRLIAFEMAEFHSYWFSGAGWASVSDVVCVCLYVCFFCVCLFLLNSCISEIQRVYVHDLDWTHGLDRPGRESRPTAFSQSVGHSAAKLIQLYVYKRNYMDASLFDATIEQRHHRVSMLSVTKMQRSRRVWHSPRALLPSYIYIYIYKWRLTGASLFSRRLQIQPRTDAERAESKGQIEACGICVVFAWDERDQSEILTNVLARADDDLWSCPVGLKRNCVCCDYSGIS